MLDGLSFDYPDEFGVRWGISLDGWDSGSGTTLELIQRLRSPGGAWASSDPQRRAKTLTLSGTFTAPTPGVALDAAARLRAAVSPLPVPLKVTDWSGTKSLMVQRSDDLLIKDITDVTFSYSVQVVAADPRKSGETLARVTALPSSSGGLSVPFTVPFSINASVDTGQITLTNPGDMTGPVVARVDGPCSDFTITHAGASGTRIFSMNLPLADGEFVVIDMENETVKAQGQTGRTQWVTSRGFAGFDPGVNTWAFSASSATAALLTITATPSYE